MSLQPAEKPLQKKMERAVCYAWQGKSGTLGRKAGTIAVVLRGQRLVQQEISLRCDTASLQKMKTRKRYYSAAHLPPVEPPAVAQNLPVVHICFHSGPLLRSACGEGFLSITVLSFRHFQTCVFHSYTSARITNSQGKHPATVPQKITRIRLRMESLNYFQPPINRRCCGGAFLPGRSGVIKRCGPGVAGRGF